MAQITIRDKDNEYLAKLKRLYDLHFKGTSFTRGKIIKKAIDVALDPMIIKYRDNSPAQIVKQITLTDYNGHKLIAHLENGTKISFKIDQSDLNDIIEASGDIECFEEDVADKIKNYPLELAVGLLWAKIVDNTADFKFTISNI